MFSIPLSTILSILVVQLTLLIRIPLRLVIISSSSSSFTMSFLTQTGTTLLINLFQELQFWARLISNFFSASFSNPAEGNSVVPQMCVTNQYTLKTIQCTVNSLSKWYPTRPSKVRLDLKSKEKISFFADHFCQISQNPF